MKKLLLIMCLLFSLGLTSQNCPPTFICNSYGTTPNGFGVQELNAANDGCLSGEHNSIWLTVTILNGGTFTFVIDPNTNSNDFDYGVWGPNSPCPPTGLPIRCSYAIQGGNGNTGLSTTATDFSEGVFGDQWTSQLNVVAGQTYLILVDNFTTNSGFNISFGGTATLDCGALPVELINFGCYQKDLNQIITWTTASEQNNWKFVLERRTGSFFVPIDTIYPITPNSTQERIYTVVDEGVVYGDNYYRLTQYDYNGQYEVFEIIICTYNIQKDIEVTYFNLLGQEISKPSDGVFIMRTITNGIKIEYTTIFLQ